MSMIYYQATDGSFKPWVDPASGAADVADQTIQPAEKSYSAWLLAGELSTVTIAISGTGTYGVAQDLTKINLDNAAIHLINTGVGTAVLDLVVSRDGFTNPFAIAGVATMAGAGVAVYKLNAASMIYGHFVAARVRETGGAATAIVKAVLMGRGG